MKRYVQPSINNAKLRNKRLKYHTFVSFLTQTLLIIKKHPSPQVSSKSALVSTSSMHFRLTNDSPSTVFPFLFSKLCFSRMVEEQKENRERKIAALFLPNFITKLFFLSFPPFWTFPITKSILLLCSFITWSTHKHTKEEVQQQQQQLPYTIWKCISSRLPAMSIHVHDLTGLFLAHLSNEFTWFQLYPWQFNVKQWLEMEWGIISAMK